MSVLIAVRACCCLWCYLPEWTSLHFCQRLKIEKKMVSEQNFTPLYSQPLSSSNSTRALIGHKTILDERIKTGFSFLFHQLFYKRNVKRFPCLHSWCFSCSPNLPRVYIRLSWKPLRFASWFPTLSPCSPNLPRDHFTFLHCKKKFLSLS